MPVFARSFVAAAVTAMLAAGNAAAVDLLPHRATYRLSLATADEQSSIAGVKGGLVIEWRAGCDGWISNQRLGFVADTDEGPGFSYDVRFSSWESPDNQALRFTVRSFDDAKLVEEFRGKAALGAAGAEGKVEFALPEGQTLALPAGTVFPTEHIRQLIVAAESGERFTSHQVFDGSGEDGLSRVTAVIGDKVDGGLGRTAWRVGLAYYKLAEDDALPAFEVTVLVTDQGIFRDVLLDYGEFSLRGTLDKLEMLAVERCD